MTKKAYIKEVRELILQDADVTDFLRYLGFFSLELKKYLVSRNMEIPHRYSRLFLHKPVGKLVRNLAGPHFRILYGQGVARVGEASKRNYPGKNICFIMNYGRFDGYARIIYEVQDSMVKTNVANILCCLQQGKKNLTELTKQFNSQHSLVHRHVKRLSSLGLILFDGKSSELTKTAQEILSLKVEGIFEKLKKQKYRIDVWE